MKKAFFAFVLCLILAVSIAMIAVVNLYGARDDVTVSTRTLQGDPAAARGLVARQSAHYDYDLRWDLTIPLDRPEDTEIDTSVIRSDIPNPYAGEITLAISAVNIGWYFTPGVPFEETLLHHPDIQPLAPVFSDVLSRTPDGTSRTETIRPADYMDTLPLAVDLWNCQPQDGAEESAFQDFFAFPVPQNMTWTVTVETNPSGSVLDLELQPSGEINSYLTFCDHTDTGLWFTFYPFHAADFSNTPGGFGLYYMDLTRENGNFVPVLDSLTNLRPLPADAQVMGLTLSPEGDRLFLSYLLAGQYHCDILTPAGDLVQAMALPFGTEDLSTITDNSTELTWSYMDVLTGEDYLLYLCRETLWLYTEEDGAYALAFSAPMTDLLQTGFESFTAAWDGERLAIAIPHRATARPTGLLATVYEDGHLAWEASFDTSLNRPGEGPHKNENFLAVDLIPGEELSLSWDT